jgi:hypothetical protein
MEQGTAGSLTGGVSPEWFEAGLHHIALGAEIASVAVKQRWRSRSVSGSSLPEADAGLSADGIGRASITLSGRPLPQGILLGLEFLILAVSSTRSPSGRRWRASTFSA